MTAPYCQRSARPSRPPQGLPVGATYNFMVKRDLPPEVLQEIADAFVAAANSDGFQEMLASKFFISDVKIGEEADREGASDGVDHDRDLQQVPGSDRRRSENGRELGLPAPGDFDSWWPPEGYTPHRSSWLVTSRYWTRSGLRRVQSYYFARGRMAQDPYQSSV